ncbi:hypothetical protein CVV65_01630 [Kyrpidia spormannii]|uniref:Uncharacterized protein n=1 Tax=Kyrpidia spormannii TaxID=2055160 RepID=A0A2K8N5I9_9BACL|nr:hypothetical protein [Kyrpidia spormannii]ATY83830.1 hypothetical protein CVV65_01630 [Kyrpidia spormannii]
MRVFIKKFNVEMQIKNNGLEFEVRNSKDEHLGDLVVTKTQLIWCEGKTQPKNGKAISWEDFIQYMNGL